jgi:membrane protein EpsK
MRSSIDEAKKRLLVNIGTNILVVAVSALVGIWRTPYLIRNLGLELYGIIPLFLMISRYSELFTMTIRGTVSRFVALSFGRNDFEKASLYFSTAFFSLMLFCLLLLTPTILFAIWLPRLFQIPSGYESQAGILFFLVILSSFMITLSSPFIVSTFVKHRFDLDNLAKVLSSVVQVLILVLCFKFLSASVTYFGLSRVGVGLVILASGVLFARCLTPELRLRIVLFKFKAFREMIGMGAWITVNQIGALLYLSIDLVVINIFLGPEQGGYYAPITQWIILLSLLGAAIGSVFRPIVYEYIAKRDLGTLAFQTQRVVKFMGMAMALPIGLICGLSRPLLERWLGPDFAGLSPLMWLLVAPCIVNIVVRPMFRITTGMNKVRLPAIVTLAGGVANLFVSILLVKYTSLGIYGVALATVFCLTSKNMIFTPIYTALIIGQRKTMFAKGIFLGIAVALLVGLTAFGLTRIFYLATIPRLLAAMVSLTAVYALFCYILVLDKEERAFLLLLVMRKSTAFPEKKDEFRSNYDEEI